jgi:ComF family protein
MDAPSGALVCPACTAALREPPWPRCPRCHFPRGTGRSPDAACLECAGWPAALAGARASTVLEPPADALVHALKYQGWKRLAEGMGRRMARVCPLPGHIVVPVPTTAARARRRGYNQAELLARAYASALHAPLVDGLVREREGPSQISLPPDQRRANVDGAFALRAAARGALAAREIALVDDVLTTGATAGAAARTLERAGVAGVIVVTFARALPGRTRNA